MKQIQVDQKPLTYNDCVKLAYHQVLKQVKQLLATVEQHELRCTLERTTNGDQLKEDVIHEFISPLIYVKLQCDSDNLFTIHFGVEEVNKPSQLSSITSNFLRLLYKVTMRDAYSINIEDCVKTDWFLKNSCSEAYEYIEERNRHHTFRQIKYKVTPAKRKEILLIA